MKLNKVLSSLALTLISGISFAGSATSEMNASSTIVATCSVVVSNVVFPSISYKTDSFQLFNLKNKCTKDLPITVRFDSNTLFNGKRVLVNDDYPDQKLEYIIMEPGQADGRIISFNGTGEEVTKWIGLAILRGQYVKAGVYRGSVTINMMY